MRPSPELSPELPTQESRAEAREAELIERLDRKATIVLDLQERLAQLKPGATPDHVEEVFDGFRARVDATLPKELAVHQEEIDAHWEKFAELQREHDEVHAAMLEGRTPVDEADARLDHLRAAMREEGEKIDRAQHNDDQRFRIEMHGLIAELWTKFHALHRKTGADVIREFSRERNAPLPMERVTTVEVGPFEAAITLPGDDYDQISNRPGTSGVHFSRTPYSLIRRGPEERVAATRRHESIHNLLDGIRSVRSLDLHWLANLFADARDPESPSRRPLMALSTERLIDDLRNELLAELENAETRDFRGQADFTANEAREIGHDMFWFYSNMYSTAGRDAQDAYQLFVSQSRDHPDPEIRLHAERLAIDFPAAFIRTVETIRSSLDRGRRLGAEADRRIHALLFILPPSRYRHLPRYLRAKYDQAADTAA